MKFSEVNWVNDIRYHKGIRHAGNATRSRLDPTLIVLQNTKVVTRRKQHNLYPKLMRERFFYPCFANKISKCE